MKTIEMKIIEHQFRYQPFYKPNWKIKYLFLGTFNPLGGTTVKYFYGRERNKTWELLSIIFNDELNPNKSDFFTKLEKHGLACMDLIDKVKVDKNQLNQILGQGYKDSKIINSSVVREYNTNSILEIIKLNPNLKVFSTWGKGATLKEWKTEVANIQKIESLVSPSMAARVPKGQKKFEYMLDNWTKKINVCQHRANLI